MDEMDITADSGPPIAPARKLNEFSLGFLVGTYSTLAIGLPVLCSFMHTSHLLKFGFAGFFFAQSATVTVLAKMAVAQRPQRVLIFAAGLLIFAFQIWLVRISNLWAMLGVSAWQSITLLALFWRYRHEGWRICRDSPHEETTLRPRARQYNLRHLLIGTVAAAIVAATIRLGPPDVISAMIGGIALSLIVAPLFFGAFAIRHFELWILAAIVLAAFLIVVPLYLVGGRDDALLSLILMEYLSLAVMLYALRFFGYRFRIVPKI